MDCDAIRLDLGAYALGSLDPAEAAAVARHLAGCSACRKELAALENAAGSLPAALAAASSLDPPERLKARLLATVSAGEPDASVSPAGLTAPAPVFATSPNHSGDRETIAETALSHARSVPTGRQLIPLWRRPLAWGGVAAAILLAVSLAWGVRLSEALDRERAMREAVAGFYSAQQAIVFEVVDAETTARRVLRPPAGSDFPTRPYGKVFTRDDMNHVVAMANRLPDAPAGQAYHLWVTLDGRTRHAGVLAPNEEGFAVLVFDADRPGPAYSAAWITLQSTEATQPGGTTVVAWQADEE